MILLETPADFSFRRTVLSHGWCLLPPFALGSGGERLETCVTVPGRGAFRIALEPRDGAVALEVSGRPAASTRRAIEAAARRILNLDFDLRPFHEAVARDPDFAWIAVARAGRLLRAPTVYEDLVKLVLTTNCSWALTTKMAGALVDLYGEPSAGGGRAFPAPARMAAISEREYREAVRAGYRGPFLRDLSARVASHQADLDAWERPDLPVPALREAIVALPGAGPYVAENMLKFLGRPDGLALDSWMRAKYFRLFHGGRKVKDRTIARRLARLGAWGGLALWFELTRDWFEGEDPSAAWLSLS